MITTHQSPEAERLSSVLREARPVPGLPPQFQQNVWRRIEQQAGSRQPTHWIEALAGLFLRPRFALATVAVVLLTGTLLGTWNGTKRARHVAQERYVAIVVMPVAP